MKKNIIPLANYHIKDITTQLISINFTGIDMNKNIYIQSINFIHVWYKQGSLSQVNSEFYNFYEKDFLIQQISVTSTADDMCGINIFYGILFCHQHVSLQQDVELLI